MMSKNVGKRSSLNGREFPANSEKELYALHADMCKVFSHPTRLAILNALRDEEMSVSDIAERAGVSVSSTSQHLSLMKERHILETRKVGNQVFYRLVNPKMVKAFDLMREIMYEQIQKQSALIATFPRVGTGKKEARRADARRKRN